MPCTWQLSPQMIEGPSESFPPISTQPLAVVAQEDAYSYAQRLYPRSAETMKKPPYLIWPGPGPTGNADV